MIEQQECIQHTREYVTTWLILGKNLMDLIILKEHNPYNLR